MPSPDCPPAPLAPAAPAAPSAPAQPRSEALRPSPCYSSALRRASRRISQIYDTAIGAAGLRSTQFSVLAELQARTTRPPTLAELAEVLVLDRSALGHNLRPLERDGYVTLVPGVDDRRVRRICLTEAGAAKFREAREHWKRAQRQVAAVLGETEAAALRDALLAIAYDERLVPASADAVVPDTAAVAPATDAAGPGADAAGPDTDAVTATPL